MSTNDPRFEQIKPTIMTKNKSDIKNQIKVINNNKDKYPDNYTPPYDDIITKMPGLMGERFQPKPGKKSDKYDPFADFLHKKGLEDRDNVIRYSTKYLNIDSSLRNKESSDITVKSTQLNPDPFIFTHLSDKLFISHPGHEFKTNDKISIQNINPIKRNLQLKEFNEYAPNTTTTNILRLIGGSQYAVVKVPHRMKFNSLLEAQNYDTSDLFVDIAGVQGSPGNGYIDNIPVNTINTRQRVILINPDDPTKYSNNTFYFKLIKVFTGNSNSWKITTPYNISITYLYIAGIPINQLNASSPSNDYDILQEYQVISSVEKNGYYITLNKQATDQFETKSGGSFIEVSQIAETINSYPNSNNYIVKLDNVLNNIVQIRIISSEFPNTQKNIKSTNNKLYWQNLTDGKKINSITLDEGNYTPEELSFAISDKISQVYKTSNVDDPILTDSAYTNKNIITVSIDKKTNIVKFESFREALLVKPFLKVDPVVQDNIDSNDTTIPYYITIKQNNHDLNVGDVIYISGSLDYNGIPANSINTMHTVYLITDRNNYIIKLQYFNFVALPQTDNNGGSTIKILTPNKFRLFFEEQDTIGDILGFRDAGQQNSITSFNNIIYNYDLYSHESPLTQTPTNNSLKFDDYNYILITCNQIEGIYTSGPIKNSLGKILLKNNNRTQINTYVDAPLYFFNTIHDLSELEFKFYDPKGNLFDFNNQDHSFTLEFTTINEIPKGTNMDQIMGIIN